MSCEELIDLGTRLFVKAGAPQEEAEIVARALAHSNLVGHDSHGVLRIPQYVAAIAKGTINPAARPKIVLETPTIAVLDCGWGFGQVAATHAMEIAIGKAKRHAISCVGTQNSNHIGRLGEYTAMAAAQDTIGIASVNNHGGGQVMAVYGGRAKRLSPNPISVAIPWRGNQPILLDITASVVAEGKLRVKRNRGEKLPEGWIVDADGNPSTEPEDFYRDPPGALLPLGGIAAHKGYGLAFVFDIICGALTGAGCSNKDNTPIGNAMMAIVLNIEHFVSREEFDQQVADLVAHVKSSPLLPGFSEILIPGEPEWREMKRRSEEGIEIDDGTWQQIKRVAADLGVECKTTRGGR